MAFVITSEDYTKYLAAAEKKLVDNKDYVTELDLATGDGDHWSNMNMGFKKLIENSDKLAELNISDEFKEIGKIMMSVIGGSSGVLYGSAYIGAAKASKGMEELDRDGLYAVLKAMLEAIMDRGQAKPGFKTMIDSLYPAVVEYGKCLDENVSDEKLCERVKTAAIDGANSTADMEAVKGRATYQADKGVGHLDPGAVTMSYQISVLMDTAKEKILA
ncbi:dihydroxyacetone kinase, phosphoprotein-dependent, L subunit [Lachnospiraceae bacterium JC7]|nr:dihydroxyacetone kinase, phosphoprotein-dependent, L subunit [Lachnospiraceae bacterium JC7]